MSTRCTSCQTSEKAAGEDENDIVFPHPRSLASEQEDRDAEKILERFYGMSAMKMSPCS